MIRKKTVKRKPYQRLLDGHCPECGKNLAVWKRHSDGQEFIGCSGYSKCTYTPKKNEVDYLREQLEVPVDWRLNLDYKLMGIFEQCQSSKEKLYLLGAVYYLETDDFGYEDIKYDGVTYHGLVFNRVYYHMKIGGSSPTSLAIVSQVEFAIKFHHDFGIFFSSEKYPTENDWWFGLAVEIDFHPKHEWQPNIDKYRDGLVKYRVLRLKKGDDPKVWFRNVEHTYNSLMEDESTYSDGQSG